jgi:hypothetical protein
VPSGSYPSTTPQANEQAIRKTRGWPRASAALLVVLDLRPSSGGLMTSESVTGQGMLKHERPAAGLSLVLALALA